MPRGMWGATAPPPSIDPLMVGGANVQFDLDYFQILANNGARRVPGRGIVREALIGAPYRQGGRWVQNTKTYSVAMSAKEAREKTKATGERWDYYEAGATCDQCVKVGGGVIAGWVLGGRKFQAEHDHVTNFDPAVYGVVEIEAPEVDEVSEETPALVEA